MKLTPRKRPRPSQFLNGIDFWAFLSIEFVLLMIFLVSGPTLHTQHGSAHLACAGRATPMPGAIREDAMYVVVTRDGNIFFGTQQIQDGELPTAIRDAVLRGSERKVYLQVDSRARYGDAEIVLDQIRETGIENIGLITDQTDPR